MISINMRFLFRFLMRCEIEVTSEQHLFLLWSHNPTILVQITVRSKMTLLKGREQMFLSVAT